MIPRLFLLFIPVFTTTIVWSYIWVSFSTTNFLAKKIFCLILKKFFKKDSWTFVGQARVVSLLHTSIKVSFVIRYCIREHISARTYVQGLLVGWDQLFICSVVVVAVDYSLIGLCEDEFIPFFLKHRTVGIVVVCIGTICKQVNAFSLSRLVAW